MKGLWKKRLKKALKDADNLGAIFGCTAFFGVVGGLILGLIFRHVDILTILGWSFGLGFLITASIFLQSDVLGKTSPHDEEIIKEETILKKSKENEANRKVEEMKKDQVKYITLMKEIIQNTKEKDEDILRELKNAIELTENILKNYSLEAKEEHLLIRSLPVQIVEIMKTYNNLTDENKAEMKPKIINMLQNKQNQLQQEYINHYQESMKKEILQRIELVENNLN